MTTPLVLIDGYGIIYQSYFAFINRPLYNPQGKNSQAVFGFLRTLLELLRERRPMQAAVIMDSKTKTFRHDVYPAYKAHRDETPPELHDQVDVIEEILSALGVPALRVNGYEADDLLATLAARAQAAHIPCVIVSKDKDILQLVGKGVTVLRQHKGGGFEEWDREAVFKALGVWPEQVVDYLALIGDQSDNIPGVPGIGPKTAVKLLSEFGSLERIYDSLETVSDTHKKKLVPAKTQAFLSKRLVTLESRVPLPDDAPSFSLGPLQVSHAVPLLEREGMTTIIKDLTADSASGAVLAGAPPNRYRTVTEKAALDDLIQAARAKGSFAFDTETDGVDELSAHVVGISLAVEPESGAYIPLQAVGVACLDEKLVIGTLKPLLEDPSLTLIGQNIKFDYKVMKRYGVTIATSLFDTMIAAWLLDSAGMGAYNLDTLAEKHLSYRTIRYSDLIEKGSEQNLSHIDITRVTDYAAEDADIALRLAACFTPLLKKNGLLGLFQEVEMPVLRILAEMELAGIRILPAALHTLGATLSERLATLEEQIHQSAGKTFNINSPKQLQEILFVDRKLTPVKKIKTGFSTDNQVLEILAQEDEIPGLILEHRSLAKLKSTYIDTLPALVNPRTGRIHTRFLQTGTATGRLSSKDPNLQNIPVREELGREIRRAFVPAPDCLFLSADYSQIELVVLAHLSRDPLLANAFSTGLDVHALTASLIFHRPVDAVTPEERRMGKTVNFGVMYGMSPFRLARDFKISKKEATTFIDEYFNRYTGVREFKERVIAEAEKNGFVTTLLGRRRIIPAISSPNRMEKSGADRIAFNTTIQGSAADIVKCAMRDIDRFLNHGEYTSRLLLQVHDELILEVPEKELSLMQKEVARLMESAATLTVPLKVNVETGESWGMIH
ncbi:MAG TPA: DNA polymerase I [Spirochaetia bacterium]|nr:DNA polymerase I [Spirochaetia bacterium]